MPTLGLRGGLLRAFAKKLFYSLDVGGNVHADGVVGGLDDTNAKAVLEPTKLLELLDWFELTGRECRVLDQGVVAKGVKTKMFPMGHGNASGSVANPWDGSTGEVECIAIEIEHDLDDIGIHDVVGFDNFDARSGDLDRRVFAHGGDDRVDCLRRNERFIALNVDVNVRGNMRGDFGDAIGAGAVIGARHDGFASESFDGGADAVVVSGDDNARDRLRKADAFDNVLNHREPGNWCKRLARKAHRGVTRGDYGQNCGGGTHCRENRVDSNTVEEFGWRYQDCQMLKVFSVRRLGWECEGSPVGD